MSILIYLLQVSACTGIFFVFYKLVLSRFTFFTINRWYLLATLLISFAIPAITIPAGAPQPLPVFQEAVFYQESAVEYAPIAVQQTEFAVEKPFDWQAYLPLAYMVAALALALKLAVSVLLFFIRIRGKQVVQLGVVKVIKGDTRFKNGSFLNYVFLDEQELSRAEVEQVLAHELVHIRLLHSVDRLFARMVQIVIWFNPFSYLYLKAITENHEFETDRAVTLGTDKSAYADLLLRLSIAPNHTLYSHFSMIPLKKRITMLFTNPTKDMKKIFYVLLLPLAVMSCLAFANREIKETEEDTKPQEKQISAIDIENLGKNPLVLIDGKEYEPSILYQISGSCISGSAIFGKEGAVKVFGPKAVDGAVKINTKKGGITYLTAVEKENLRKIAASKNGFYNRISLADNKGLVYDQVQLNFAKGGSVSCTLKSGSKAGFMIGNKVFDESQIQVVEQMVNSKYIGAGGVGESKRYAKKGLNLSAYEIIFQFDYDSLKSNKQGYRYEKAPGKSQIGNNLINSAPINAIATYSAQDSIRIDRKKDRVILYGNAEYNIGNTTLSANVITIDNKRPLSNAQNLKTSLIDTTEFASDAFQLRSNATADELLKVIPGIKVGTDRAITVNGRLVSRLMVDGKEFFTSTTRTSTNIPAEIIDKVQVITSETSTAINLKLKRKIVSPNQGSYIAQPLGITKRIDDVSDIYSRVKFAATGTKGAFERVSMSSASKRSVCSVDIPPGGKVAIIVLGKLYTEKDLSEVYDILKTREIWVRGASDKAKMVEGIDVSNFDGTLFFKLDMPKSIK